jgi:hypothetical protein
LTAAVLLAIALCSQGASAQAQKTAPVPKPAAVREGADDYYNRGMQLAGDQRWEDALAAFDAGRRLAPRDKRFPLEIAGVEFKQKNYETARRWVLRALALDPKDAYGINFLATLYMIEGNPDAAIKTWNRIGKPRIEDVRMEPRPNVDPVLLDRAFAFSPAGVLNWSEYRATEARVAMLGTFSRYRFDLVPGSADNFNVMFRSSARGGWLSMLRGLPFQTVRPALWNINRSGLNVDSLVRWDSQKRRAFLDISAPISRNPKWRLAVYADGRNENWNVPGPGFFNMERTEAGLGLRSAVSGRLEWSGGFGLSHRTFRGGPFQSGSVLIARTGARYNVFDIPERRLLVRAGPDIGLGRLLNGSRPAFSTVQGSVSANWFPQARGEDWEINTGAYTGAALGPAPFDELFILGLERDNTLWLRGHIGTHNGQKGSAPIGSRYALTNFEVDRLIYNAGFATLKLGPFFDTGRVFGPTVYGPRQWLFDTGLVLKLSVLRQLTMMFVYGKDLRTGHNAFYALSSR